MPAFMRCSLPSSTPPSCRARGDIGQTGHPAACSAQCPAAPGGVLVYPLVYPLGLSDHQLEHRGNRMAAPPALRRKAVHSRLLARAAADDPNGMAPPRADAPCGIATPP